ncbi:hypothetical protein Droror1_Dr00009941 [Drosera rotundifolia]
MYYWAGSPLGLSVSIYRPIIFLLISHFPAQYLKLRRENHNHHRAQRAPMAAAAAISGEAETKISDHIEPWKLKFPAFPYKPYSIQLQFMESLYKSLDSGGISMLESPTGTGKTLSLICSALQWLVDRRKKPIAEEANQCGDGGGDDDEPDWLRNYVVPKPEVVKKKTESKKIDRVVKHDRVVDLFGEKGGNEGVEKVKVKSGVEEKNDDEFLMQEYESGGEDGIGKRKKGYGVGMSSSSEEDEEEGGWVEDEGKGKGGMKVYFCSRTHSQLSQFVKELRKTGFGSELNVVSLGSRKNLCINEDVLKLGNATRINERCLELQKNKKSEKSKTKNLGTRGRKSRTKASCGCPMLRNPKLQKEFISEVLEQDALDIEDLVDLGSRLGTCPYYGSRSLVPSADLVILPYQSLLSKSSRGSLGLDLKGSVVIIDEAHNLADSLISMYDAKVTTSQLENVHQSLEGYLGRFQKLLGPGNRRYIQTLKVVTRAFLQVLHHDKDRDASCDESCDSTDEKNSHESSMAINDFLFSLDIDNINFVKLMQYIKESNIIRKVSGYRDKVALLQNTSNLAHEPDEGSTLSGFHSLVDLLLSLTNKNADGRIIISRTKSTSSKQHEGSIKYVMLTGEKIFAEILDQAHAVVLVGGTLQPIEETRERLFPWLSPEDLHFFSCNHIVPPESIMPIAVSRGPSGLTFDFSYSSRSSPKMMEELGLLLCNISAVVPEGIVVFFSSFDYEAKAYDTWKASGILQRITRKKIIFREPRSNTDIESVLKEYKDTIDRLSINTKESQASQNGALLLAVVGGKISEGINFSDGMGRCIVMVGLPYPSPSDIELLERIKHIEGLEDTDTGNTSTSLPGQDHNVQAGFDILHRCKRRGREYYENLCMKAVNQSIGRAIRHKNDYAAILLVDSRYATDPSKRSSSHPVNKLPQWIKDRLVPTTSSYGEVHRLLNQFFRHNKNKGV